MINDKNDNYIKSDMGFYSIQYFGCNIISVGEASWSIKKQIYEGNTDIYNLEINHSFIFENSKIFI